MPIGLAVHQQVLTTANTDDIMPKEQRRASHSYRQDPLERAPEETFSHRSTSIWTAEDDEILLAARAQGMNWQPIAEAHFPSKSGNACRKRHERLLEKGKAEDWDTNKLEKLSEEYMAVRKEMWSVLAVILEEKWQNVEAKVRERLRKEDNDQLILMRMLVHGEGPQKSHDIVQSSHTQEATRYGSTPASSVPAVPISKAGQWL
jgi:hypothetical protein